MYFLFTKKNNKILKDHEIEFIGNVGVESSGLNGVFCANSFMYLYREQLDFGDIIWIRGSNKNTVWETDENHITYLYNNKLDNIKYSFIKAIFDHFFYNKKSDNFTFEKIKSEKLVNNEKCYIYYYKSVFSNESITLYYRIKDNLLIKSIEEYYEDTLVTTYYKYKEFDKFSYPTKIIEERLKYKEIQIVDITNIIINKQYNVNKFNPQKSQSHVIFKTPSKIKFINYYNNISLEVKIDESTYYFGLDTGSSQTIISNEIVKKHNLNPIGHLHSKGGGHKLFRADFVYLKKLQINDLLVKGQIVSSVNISAYTGKSPYKLSGLLGYDFFSQVVIKIDYKNNTMYFINPNDFKYRGKGYRLKFEPLQRFIVIDIELGNNLLGKFDLDTGSSISTISNYFAVKNNLLQNIGSSISANAFGGKASLALKKFKEIIIDENIKIKNVEFAIKTGKANKYNRTIWDGNIGNNILKDFTLIINYPNKEIIFEKYKNE